jgi:hypothetical protein
MLGTPNRAYTETISIGPELVQISYISRATNCRSTGLSLRSLPIQPNVINPHLGCAAGCGGATFGAQAEDDLVGVGQIHALI